VLADNEVTTLPFFLEEKQISCRHLMGGEGNWQSLKRESRIRPKGITNLTMALRALIIAHIISLIATSERIPSSLL
jgi:hypothetical protein